METKESETSKEGQTSLPDEKVKDAFDEGVENEPEKGAAETPVADEESDKTGEKPAEAPKPRQYSEEEWNKRQSAWDKGFSDKTRGYETRIQELEQTTESARSQLEEFQLNQFLGTVEAQGGDLDSAKAIVAREKLIRTKERELAAAEAKLRQQNELLTQAAKSKTAFDLAKQYGLGEESIEDLLSAADPTAMENKALKLVLDKGKTEGKKATKVATNTSPAKGVDWGKASDSKKFEIAWQD